MRRPVHARLCYRGGIGKPRRFTDEQETEIAAAYASGASSVELAVRYETNPSTICYALRRQGMERRPTGLVPGTLRRFSEEEANEVLARYAAGESRDALARAFGVGSDTITRLLKQRGVAIEQRYPSREKHHFWQGGRSMSHGGYVYVMLDRDDPLRSFARKDGYMLEHRLVMARQLGRPLGRHETVHHKNGDRADNRLENLELRVGHHGQGATQAHCATCTCFD